MPNIFGHKNQYNVVEDLPTHFVFIASYKTSYKSDLFFGFGMIVITKETIKMCVNHKTWMMESE